MVWAKYSLFEALDPLGMAQSRSHLCISGSKVSITSILGALGSFHEFASRNRAVQTQNTTKLRDLTN